jgi:adenosylmethionine-8-amino-7-oxononanoate aminotransferase
MTTSSDASRAAPSSADAGWTQDRFFKTGSPVPVPMIERGQGIYLWDEDGNRYIDASSGPVVSNIGHGDATVAQAMADQATKMDFAYARLARHRPNEELARRVSELAGPGFERVNFLSGGTEAVEVAIKLLRQYVVAKGQVQKRRIISCMPSFHGSSIFTLGVTGDSANKVFLSDFSVESAKIPAPFSYRLPEGQTPESHALRCAEELESTIRSLGAENVLAFIIEPVGGLSTGCVVPPAAFFKRIREICSAHGVFLIFDEVLCGTGRTGKFLACHHWPDSRPDIVVLAKGLGSGYSPLGAVLAPAALVDELSELTGFNFSHTYSANPVSCAAGLAVLDVYEKQGLVDAARDRGAELRALLEDMKTRVPIIGDIRGAGLLMAMELVTDRHSKAPFPATMNPADLVRIHGLRNGLMLYARRVANGIYGDWFMVSPPLTITLEECRDLARRLEQTLVDFQAEMAGKGILSTEAIG